MTSPLAVIVLAAGQGTRMKSAQPKVLHRIANRPMLAHVLAAARALAPERVVAVIGPAMDAVAAAAAPAETVVQGERRGTAHAVAMARPLLDGFLGEVLVLYGDSPLIRSETLTRLLHERRRRNAAVAVIGMRPAEPGPYGRLMLGEGGALEAIVEAAEGGPEVLANGFCNSGVMALDSRVAFDLIDAIGCRNSKNEYYLTDIVGIARGRGLACAAIEAPAEELLGVNSRAELAAAEAAMQQRLREQLMADGVTFTAPETVFLSADTRIGRDSIVGPFVVCGERVAIGEGVEIPAFCHLAGATIGDHAVIGPFARLRPGAELSAQVHIGNFVEVKNSRLAPGVKANHFTYLGDTSVGSGTNIGAGTITCNYDGVAKHRTEIGEGVFIGTNSSLVAPVKIGDRAMVGAGSVITADVPADALALGRARQVVKRGGAKLFRAKLVGVKTGAAKNGAAASPAAVPARAKAKIAPKKSVKKKR